MADYELKKGAIAAKFQTHGAELISLTKNGTEYIWNADPAYWGRHTPVLFPFVGQVWDKKYRFEGVEYAMGQHGFARDMDFALKAQTEDSISFILHENEETLAKYPFRFELEIRYTLGENSLRVEWIVRNPDTKPLYFSIGGHPAFLCPIGGRGDWDDYRIGLTKDGNRLSRIAIRPITEGGCFGDELDELTLTDGTLTPSDSLFAGDALVLEDHEVDRVSLIDPDGKEYLAVESDAPCMGIWSPVGKHAPFICIEPWYGRADRVGFSGDLSEREYGNVLGAGEVFDRSFTITV